MGYCVMEIEGQDNEITVDKDKIVAFKEKWKSIIDLFGGDFFTEEDERVYLFTGKDFSINSRNFPTLDDGKANKDRAFARFFSQIIESTGDCNFGFGQEGFKSDFYKDLLDLCDGFMEWCVLSVNCGESGYHTGNFELGESGLYESFTYYESEDEE